MPKVIINASKEALSYAAKAIELHVPAANAQGRPLNSGEILNAHGLISEAILRIASPIMEAVNKELQLEKVEGNVARAPARPGKKTLKKKLSEPKAEDDE